MDDHKLLQKANLTVEQPCKTPIKSYWTSSVPSIYKFIPWWVDFFQEIAAEQYSLNKGKSANCQTPPLASLQCCFILICSACTVTH